MTPDERDKLQDDYVQQCVDDMDLKTLMAFAYETIDKDLENYSNDELTDLVKEIYPELLNETPNTINYKRTKDQWSLSITTALS